MKTYLPFVALLLTLSIIAAQCGSAPADQDGNPKIMVMEPFARASMPNGAVYLNLMNEGDRDDILMSAESDVAEAVELHLSKMDDNGVMKMSPVPNIPVPAGDTVTLEPGGLHIMLLGLKEALATGDKFRVTLNFEQSGSKTIEVEVRESMATGHQMEHDMEAMDSDKK